MKFFVGNTDPTWFRFLSNRNQTTEVNFWRPGGRQHSLQVIAPGDLFFFHLKSPYQVVAGFGRYAHHSVLPLWLAWDAFDKANGCESREALVGLIAKYRKDQPDSPVAINWPIGCTVLTDVCYYNESEWLDLTFPPGLVQGRSFDTDTEVGLRIWEHMLAVQQKRGFVAEAATITEGSFSLVAEEHATYATESVKQRFGQGAFRVMVLDAYNRRCCVSGERTLPVIEAAHIQEFVSPESNHVQNGLALREDIHTLFDRGYVTVEEDYRFIVSGRLREDFENGRDYYRFHGKPISLPARSALLPSVEAIRWHQDNVYLG